MSGGAPGGVGGGVPGGVSTPGGTGGDAASAGGWIASAVAAELPGLRLLQVEAQVRRPGSLTGDSPADIEARLRELSNRVRGARAIAIRREPVPAAYRVLFRQIGLDPDAERTPVEAAVVERMLRGGFLTGGLLEDVLLIALIDTGVPVRALDAERLRGALGIRESVEGEALGADGPLLPAGRLVVADGEAAAAVLFGDPAPDRAPRRDSRRLALYAVLAPGVPALYAEEALWSCQRALETE